MAFEKSLENVYVGGDGYLVFDSALKQNRYKLLNKQKHSKPNKRAFSIPSIKPQTPQPYPSKKEYTSEVPTYLKSRSKLKHNSFTSKGSRKKFNPMLKFAHSRLKNKS